MSIRVAQIHEYNLSNNTLYTVSMESDTGLTTTVTASSLEEAKSLKERFERGEYRVLTEG